MTPLVLMAFSTVLLASPAGFVAAEEIHFSVSPDRAEIRVEGLEKFDAEQFAKLEKRSDLISLHLMKEGQAQSTPLLGVTKIVQRRLVFHPRFPLNEGATFRVVLRDPERPDVEYDAEELKPGEAHDGFLAVADLMIPMKAASVPAQVEQVFPSTKSVPENLLKFYIQFSKPMGRGLVYDKAKIYDSCGKVVEGAFLEIGEELWSQEGDRITLLFDPGRIKRELRPREEIGSPLREGNAYRLIIDSTWTDKDGQPLEMAYVKEFAVVAHDAISPDPKRWKISVPNANTDERICLQFEEPLDRAMLEHAIRIVAPNGSIVDGRIEVGEEERQWCFYPESHWSASEYQIEIDTDLEDRAGNSITKPFEVDLTREFKSSYPEATTSLKFHPDSKPDGN